MNKFLEIKKIKLLLNKISWEDLLSLLNIDKATDHLELYKLQKKHDKPTWNEIKGIVLEKYYNNKEESIPLHFLIKEKNVITNKQYKQIKRKNAKTTKDKKLNSISKISNYFGISSEMLIKKLKDKNRKAFLDKKLSEKEMSIIFPEFKKLYVERKKKKVKRKVKIKSKDRQAQLERLKGIVGKTHKSSSPKNVQTNAAYRSGRAGEIYTGMRD